MTNSREAYEIAKKSSICDIKDKKPDKNSRTKSIYALFACKMGEHEHAHAVMGNPTRPNTLMVNLTLKILTELELHEDALAYILDNM